MEWNLPGCILLVLQKQLQIDLKHGLQQSHVRSLVQPHLVLPNIDDEHLTSRQRKESALALKVLIFASLAAISTLNIHHQDIWGHARPIPGTFLALLLVLRQPDTLGCLPPLQL